MKNISLVFQFHAPYRLKRYRFFEIGQDHYYYDDMQNEESISWLVEKSYMPLCQTLKEMIQFSHSKFHCGISLSGIMLDMFQQYAPEMIDILKELADSKCVEFLATPFAYSLAAEYNKNEFEDQVRRQAAQIEELFGQKPTTIWNTELLYSDEIGDRLLKMGFKAVMTEGAKQILSWKSPNYVYNTAVSPKMKLLLRNSALSDELAFHFSDYNWKNYPIDAEKYAAQLAGMPEQEQIANIWLGAETFGIRQSADTGIFGFLKALPFYVLEKELNFLTPQEAAKKLTAADTNSVFHIRRPLCGGVD